MEIKPGDIVIVNNWNGNFLSSAIRFFTKSWSHTAIGFFPFIDSSSMPEEIKRFIDEVVNSAKGNIFEANLTVGITDWAKTFNDPDYDVRVYRWIVPLDNLNDALWTLFDKYNTNIYGAEQLIWFIWRWIVEKLHLPKRWAIKNFFPNLEVCTEIIYVALMLLRHPVVKMVLNEQGRDQNTVHPGDIIWICDRLVEEKMMEVAYNRQRH